MTEFRQALPRGRHAAPREVVATSQRARLLDAMAMAVAQEGYGATAVADVIAGAGVSRKSFYEHFPNKEACFLAAYDASVDELFAHIEAAIADEDEPFAAAEAGTRAYLERLAQRPHLARTFLVEVLAAGDRALERRAAVHARFATYLEGFYAAMRAALPELPVLPAHRFRACVGATNELVAEHLRTRGPATLPELADAVSDVQVGLLLGHDVAARLRG